jgi:hypothetical protein
MNRPPAIETPSLASARHLHNGTRVVVTNMQPPTSRMPADKSRERSLVHCAAYGFG